MGELPAGKIVDRVKYKFFGRIPVEKNFVFGVGLSKTGTTSLNSALNTLGWNSHHLPPITKAEEGELRLTWPWWLSKFDAATDLSVAAVFDELDCVFPNASFIYTHRDKEKWLESCSRQFTPELAALRVQQGNQWILELCEIYYGSAVFDKALFSAAYDRHHDRVMGYFDGKDNFLSFDLVHNANWRTLCAFLDCDVPDTAFPRENVRNPAPEPAACA